MFYTKKVNQSSFYRLNKKKRYHFRYIQSMCSSKHVNWLLQTNRWQSHHDQLTTLQTHLFSNWLPDQPTADTRNYCPWRMCM